MLCKNPHVFEVVPDALVPKVIGRGRKLGKGKNLDMLNKMEPGSAIFEVPFRKMKSIKYTAWKNGIKIIVRRLPTKGYMIKKT